MAFMSHETEISVPYTKIDCFKAIKAAANTLPKWKLKRENEAAGMMQFNVSPGMSSFTWGDVVNVTISLNQNGSTKIHIISTAKAASVLASSTEVKNVQELTDAIFKALNKFEKIVIDEPAPTPVASAADEIKKFKELLDMGAITQDEFDEKKKQLLGL